MPFLDWINKNQAKDASRDVPYHLLKQEAIYGDGQDNLLIQGDNLLALKALIPLYAGQVKCIFIDPPYNTQSAFEHYDDKLEHSQWLSMMLPRLVLLRDLLAENGSIWVAVDDNEAHYLKVLLDEVFGRRCFVANLIWEKADSPRNSARQFSTDHDHILVFSKTPDWQPRRLQRTEEANSIYSNPDDDERGPWIPGDPYANKPYSKGLFSITGPTGRVFSAPPGRYWRVSEEKLMELNQDGRVWWGPTGDARPSIKRFLAEVADLVPRTLWRKDDAGSNRTSKNEMRALYPEEASFGTPKPERLIQRVLQIATSPGDLVLDSFLGSGTTAAVAHKMDRRYIGIEMGDHARTHCIPRLQKVIGGEQGGISKSEEWKGGGGFRFCTLGEPAFDADGRINAAVDFATLAAFVWHAETGQTGQQAFDSPLLGIHNGTAYYLLYKDILGDRQPAGGNALTHAVLDELKKLHPHDGPKVVYGETSRLGAARLAADNIQFKQIPYDVTMR
ncbi:site-specific DNA-methyltransferase [Ralstonia sp. UBA689]|uniref:site-specific DNA-methyltransferase n=1 Tax=Ralstonia sp. UBA689 TaxID=1947373 RepID=UPI0025DD8382|nr:site-specific DNA-methyltransferase [Ralstonia sp. UBA689]